MRQDLPVAGRSTVTRRVRNLGRRHRRALLACVGLQLLATLAALAPPRLLGPTTHAPPRIVGQST